MTQVNIGKQTSCPICGAGWPKNLRKSFRRLEKECPICYAEQQRRMDWAITKSLKKLEEAAAVYAAEVAKLTPEQLRAQADLDIKDLYGD